MKKLLPILIISAVVASCGGSGNNVVHDTVQVIHDTVVINKTQDASHTGPIYRTDGSIVNKQRQVPHGEAGDTSSFNNTAYDDVTKVLVLNYVPKHIWLTISYEFTGTILNTSTRHDYKDVVLLVKQFSETGTKISSQQYPVYKYFERGVNRPFSLTVDKINGTDYATCEVVSASSIN